MMSTNYFIFCQMNNVYIARWCAARCKEMVTWLIFTHILHTMEYIQRQPIQLLDPGCHTFVFPEGRRCQTLPSIGVGEGGRGRRREDVRSLLRLRLPHCPFPSLPSAKPEMPAIFPLHSVSSFSCQIVTLPQAVCSAYH